jgi:hypothetical protein
MNAAMQKNIELSSMITGTFVGIVGVFSVGGGRVVRGVKSGRRF